MQHQTTRYTREVIEGKKRLASATPKRSHSKKSNRATLRNRRTFGSEFVLQLRLQTPPYRRPTASADAPSLINQCYAKALTPRNISNEIIDGPSGMFVIDPGSKDLFSTPRLGRRHGGPELCVTPAWSIYTQYINPYGHEIERRRLGPPDSRWLPASCPFYHNAAATHIVDSRSMRTATVVKPGCIVWAANTSSTAPQGATLYVATRYSSLGVPPPWQRYADEFGDWGTTEFTWRDCEIFDCAAAPTSETGAEVPPVVIGTDQGIVIRDSRGDMVFPRNFGRRRRQFHDFATNGDDHNSQEDVLSVGWQSHNTYLAGRRDGKVLLGDVRTRDTNIVARLSTGHGGAARVATVGRGCDWGVLAWGLQTAGIWDLRFSKDESPPESTGSVHKTARNVHNPRTAPLLSFNIHPAFRQRRYHLGWAYDPDSAVVAAVYPTYSNSSKIMLWDARTGGTLAEPLQPANLAIKGNSGWSGLVNKIFAEQIRNIQFVDFEGGGGIDTGGLTKSLVVGIANGLESWDV